MNGTVRAERERRGMSVREAARRGGVSNTTWSRYESGETSLTGNIRKAVAQAFDWPIGWPDGERPAPHTWEPNHQPDPADLVVAVREAIDEGRERSLKMDEVVASVNHSEETLVATMEAMQETLGRMSAQIAKIGEFVRRRESALERRPGELD